MPLSQLINFPESPETQTVHISDLIALAASGDTGRTLSVLCSLGTDRLARLYCILDAASCGHIPTAAQRAELDDLMWETAKARAALRYSSTYAQLLSETV